MALTVPVGLGADPTGVPRCPRDLAISTTRRCPQDTQVGMFVMETTKGEELDPIVNIDPEAGEAAELGLETPDGKFPLTARMVRLQDNYGLQLTSAGLPTLGVLGIEATLWGVPADPVHDPERGLFCTGEGMSWKCEGGGEPAGVAPAPLLTSGADCAAGAQAASAYVDSWQEPQAWASGQASLPGVTGCDLLSFAPKLALEADTRLAEAPVGLGLGIEEPSHESAQGTASPPLRSATVSLPAGMALNAAGAEGLAACLASGPEGIDIPTGTGAGGQPLLPEEVQGGEEVGGYGLKRLAPGHCPEGSVVGTAEASAPALERPLQGRVYLAAPVCGEAGKSACGVADALDGGLYKLYIELGGRGELGSEGDELPGAQGTIIKIDAQMYVQPTTGQITVVLSEAPQLPLTNLTLKLKGGPRALLANPPTCGPATTSADLVPWSAPGTTPEGLFVTGTPDAASSSSYQVTGCASPPALAPGFVAGTLDPSAGSTSPFTLTVTRNDREQYLSGLRARLPEGVTARLAGVALCQEPAAREGACPPAARIGSSLVQAGAGSAPLALGGDVYLTGPHGGSPFGLAIVTHAQIGPFDLGTVTIGARVDIDPHTAALTITSDPLPQILLGIPLRLRRITLTLDRPGFILNPTGCQAKAVTATVAGAQGASASVSSPFAAGYCSELRFTPTLNVATQGNGQFAGHGASLDVVVRAPARQANIRALKLDLPRRLPARASTIRQACRHAVFEADPAACPAASRIGAARVITPVLGTPMVGPVFLVTSGKGGFPDMIVVLQGQGVRIDLIGAMYVSARNITSTAFRSMPDVPISRFELYLPEGPHSALVAGSSLCKRPRALRVLAAIAAHNGARVKRVVPVGVKGCRRPHRKPRRARRRG